MYRFLLSRRWIVAGVVVLAAAVTMIELGLWQLRRSDEVKSANRLVRARLASETVSLDEILGSGDDPAEAVYRRVEVVGTYDVGSEIAVDNRSSQGRPGRHLLTPLVTPDGKALLVDRGWISLEVDAVGARPPSNRVTVVGVLFPSERKGTFGPTIPAAGRLTRVPRIDVARIGDQLAYPSYPLYARLVSQTPGQPSGLPEPPGLPDLSDGPHRSYAVQWFLFTTVAVAVFAALARKEARKRARVASSG